MNFLKDIWDTEGPLGIPMKDKQALQMEALLKDLPRDDLFKPGFLITEKATTELLPGERADVSWISTEDRDRVLDMVIASGMQRQRGHPSFPIIVSDHVVSEMLEVRARSGPTGMGGNSEASSITDTSRRCSFTSQQLVKGID